MGRRARRFDHAAAHSLIPEFVLRQHTVDGSAQRLDRVLREELVEGHGLQAAREA